MDAAKVAVSRSAGASAKHFGKGIISLAGAAMFVSAALWCTGLPTREFLAQFDFTNPAVESQHSPAHSESFHQESRHSGVRNGSETPAPVGTASSSLRVLSTAPGRNLHEGTAILGKGPDADRTYVAGALLSDGTRLTEIHRDSVVLTRGPQRWTLHADGVPKEISAPESTKVASGQPQFSANDSPSHEPLTQFVRPSPVYDETSGALLGYEVYPGTDQRTFQRIGLEPSDVILRIDRVPLNQPAAVDLLRQLTRGVALTATVQRNGSARNLSLNGVVTLDRSGDRH